MPNVVVVTVMHGVQSRRALACLVPGLDKNGAQRGGEELLQTEPSLPMTSMMFRCWAYMLYTLACRWATASSSFPYGFTASSPQPP